MTRTPTAAAADVVAIPDIATRLGIPITTIRTWRRRGKFPEPRWTAAGNPLWHLPDIERWLRSKDGKAAAAETETAGPARVEVTPGARLMVDIRQVGSALHVWDVQHGTDLVVSGRSSFLRDIERDARAAVEQACGHPDFALDYHK